MERLIFGLLFTIFSTSAIAHEGHGVATNAVMHYFTLPHLLVSICFALLVVGLYSVISKYLRQRQ